MLSFNYMPSYDFLCDSCKTITEVLFAEKGQKTAPCKNCGMDAELFWLKAPGMSPDVWDNSYHPSIGTYNSRQEMQEKMERRGLMLDEPGMEKDIAATREQRFNKELSDLKEDVWNKTFAKMTLDECNKAVEASANSPGYVLHPEASPAGVPVTPQHIEKITGCKVG